MTLVTSGPPGLDFIKGQLFRPGQGTDTFFIDQWNVRLAIPGVFCPDAVAKELVYQSLICFNALKGCLHEVSEAVEGHLLVGYSAFFFKGSKVPPGIVAPSVIDSFQFGKQAVIRFLALGKQMEPHPVNQEGVEWGGSVF